VTATAAAFHDAGRAACTAPPAPALLIGERAQIDGAGAPPPAGSPECPRRLQRDADHERQDAAPIGSSVLPVGSLVDLMTLASGNRPRNREAAQIARSGAATSIQSAARTESQHRTSLATRRPLDRPTTGVASPDGERARIDLPSMEPVGDPHVRQVRSGERKLRAMSRREDDRSTSGRTGSGVDSTVR
jgi:hypothetical protein